MPLSKFADAIADSETYTKRHLLLGNGFSIACRADIFHYGSLFARADFSAVPEVVSVFDALHTQDFEAAIHALENAARILPAYLGQGTVAQAKMLEHAGILKEILVQTIAGNHPHIPLDIPDPKFWVVCLGKTGPILKRALRGMRIGEIYGTSAFYTGADHREAA